MSIEIRVPQLPESVADATLSAWHKQIGQPVQRDENLADLETDKVMLEIPAPVSGVLREIKVAPGTTVKSGAVLALIEEGATAAADADADAEAAPAPPPSAPRPRSGAAAAAAAMPAAVSSAAPAVIAPPAPTGNGGAQGAPSAEPPATPRRGPAARRVLEENKLSASALGNRSGRISKADALAAASQAAAASAPATPNAPPTPAREEAAVAPVQARMPSAAAASATRSEQRVPMSRLRARIAERLLQAQASAALLTTFNEVDLTAVQKVRARHKQDFEKRHGVKLGLMSFFVKASIEALRRFAVVNAAVDGNEIIYHEYYDIGVAVSTDRGLMVPVLRDADAMSFADIEQRIGEYAQRARAGSISLEELTGGTFSITNGGIFGSLMSTPIVNAPQSAILGMHKVQERAMVVNGQVLARPMMYLALTYDHRIIDGREAVQFLVTVKDCLEDPARLLLGI